MSTQLQTPTTGPVEAVPQAAGEAEAVSRFSGRLALVVLIVVLLFAGTYALAWFNANRLTQRFAADADAMYAQGEYLQALVGGQEFNPQSNQYRKIGGYLDVENIWSTRYSWPAPPVVVQARQRSDEIINELLTIEQAEEYIQANIGRSAPYFGEIYLRLGELYEEEGDIASARDIYESIPELFPGRTDLSDQAAAHLERLDSE